MRTSPTHYVAPEAIAITPNANNSYNDLAVYVAPNTVIKVYCPKLGIGVIDNDNFQTWQLAGRNRRLADSIEGYENTRPYTIYARLEKLNQKNGYVVFAPKQQYGGEWYDKYSYITKDGLSISFVEGIDGRTPAAVDDPTYWYVKIGEVTKADNTKQRSVNLDIGILGTEGWNTEWALNPDALPLRIDMSYLLSNIVGDEWTAITKYVRWEQVLHVNAKLVEGWTGTDITRFHHWEITRNTGSEEADSRWNEAHDGQGSDSGNYTSTEFDLYLVHARGSGDDFNGVMQALFTFTAYQVNPDYTPDSGLPPYLPLTSMAFTVLAETIETFELEENSSTVTYNPQSGKYVPEIEYDDQTQEYSSESGTTVRVKATNADKETFYPTDEQIEAIGLHVYYRPVDDDNDPTELDLVNGRGVLPSAPFLDGKSVDVWLQVGEWVAATPDSNIILSRKTITYIRDGVSTPNCIVERQVVFIPTDSDGYVTEDCEVRVPFRVMMGNRRLAISGATITEDSDSRYATLNGGAIQDITGTKITVVGHKAIMQDATVEGHKAILGSSYVAGPQAVTIKVSKGVKIDEHLVDLTVTGVDSDGTEYETYAGIEILGNAAGSAGEDAKEREWIYKRSDSQPETPANPEDRTTDDYIPAGWSDRPSGVDNNHKTEWTSWRDYDKGSQQWGDFRQPVIWSHFGRNGQDGDGVEYVFIRTKNNIAPVMDNVQEGYESDEFRPTITSESQTASQTEQAQTTDDPKGTDKTYKYEWVAKRSMGAPDATTGVRQWTKFTGVGDDYKMSLWSTFAESITKVSETPYYIKNTTGTRPAENDPDWSETKPATLNEGEWLFTKTVITWSDGSKTVLYSSERNPNDGKAGQDIIVDGATVMKYAVSDSNAHQPTQWSDYDNIKSQIVPGKWLWSQATTNYKKADGSGSAGSSVNYNVSYIGEDGKDGRSIVSITEYYKASANASGETAPSDDSGWSTNPNTAMSSWNEANKYLWNYEKITYSSGVTVERTIPQVLAIWTKDGAAGKGIDSITNYYKVTDSNDAPSRDDDGWTTTPQAPGQGEYLWNYEKITWLNPAGTTYTDVQQIGYAGTDGKSITKKGPDTIEYVLSTDGVNPKQGESWSTTRPTPAQGEYVLVRTTVHWSDDTTTVLISSERNPNDGKAGQDIIVDGATVMKYYVGNSNTTHPADDSSDWKDLSQITQEQGKWLWSQATTYYRKADSAAGSHDAGSSINYNVSYISKDGAAGRAVTSITEYYKADSSNTPKQKPTSDDGWSTDPNVQNWGATDKYLWNYEKVEYTESDGTKTYERTTPQILAIWTKDGAAGKGIDSIQNHYMISNSLTPPAKTDSHWSTTPIAPTAAEPYLWNYETISWLNPSSTTDTPIQMIGHFGKDGISVSAQYSADGTNWHDTFQSGDKWMRTSSDGGTTWTAAMKIVGENGSETDYSFGISQYKTTDDAETPPTDIGENDWQDNPIEVTTAKPYLWSRVIQKSGDGTATGTRYIRLTGEDGADGTSAASCFLDKSAVFVPVDTDGYVIDDFEAFVHFSVYCGTAPITSKSAQVDEGGHQQYIELTGGKMTDMTGTVITVNNHTAIINEGASVSGHKVTLTGNYVTSPNALRVRVQRGWQIDEHVATLQVIAEDSDGNEYLCRAPLSIQREVIAKDGKDGKDGTSITKKGSDTIEYVLSTDGVNPKQGESWSITRPTPAQGEYVLVRTTVHWSDDTTTVLISSERNPNDGKAGQDIIVDGATVMKYAVSDSNAVQPTQWSDYDNIKSQIVPGKWLWSQATTNYKKADGSGSAGSSVNYNVSYIGVNGANGRAITATSEHYNVSDSSSTQWNVPTSGDWANEWTTDPNVPDQQGKTQWNQNKRYLWNYEKITYQESNGNTTINRTIPRVVAIWTKDGKGIDTIVNKYAINNDPLTVPTTGWDDDAMAPTAENPYLWNYEVVTWTDGASTGGIEYAHVIGHFGKDGISVLAQYSANGTNWHSSFQSGDKWMRTSSDGGTTWSDAAKIVGENGSETDYSFGISQYKTTTNAETAPSDITIWSDNPIEVTTAKPYLWSRVVKKDGSGTAINTSYIRLTGEDGADAQYIYLKGTARDVDGTITDTIPCEVKVNGGTSLVAEQRRGLNLVTINRQTLARVESINYDTYGEAAGETGARGITDLIARLGSLDDSVFVCLVSFDAIGWQRPADVTAGTYPLITALQGYGMGELPYTATGRYPFLFIGYKNLGKGNGLTRMRNLGAYTDVVELSVYVANGALTVKDGKDGENAIDYKIVFTDPTFALDPNTKKNVVSIKGAVYKDNVKITNITVANFAMRFVKSDGTVRELKAENNDFGIQNNEFVTSFGNGNVADYKTFVVDYKSAGTVVTQNSLARTVYGEKGMDAISGYADYLYSRDDAGNNRPAASASLLGKIDLLEYHDGNSDRIDICEGSDGSYSWEGYGASDYPDGTMFVCRVDNHIYRATANGWQDEGRFKGDNAVVYKIEFTDSTFALDPNTAQNVVDVRGIVYKSDGGNTSVFTTLGTDSSLELYFLKTNPVSGQPPIQEQIPANLITISNGAFSTNSQDGAPDRGEMAIIAIVKIGTGSNAKEVTRANIPRGKYGTDGAPGSRGKRGRSYYYAQPWQDNPNVSYLVNDSVAPYFYLEDDGEYYVYNPVGDVNDKVSMHDMGKPSTSNPNWEQMQSKFKYLITEAIFGNFAKFGSAIISGDWMISTNGTIDGTAYNNGALYNNSAAYTWFDPQYPNKSVNTTHSVNGEEWTGFNFVPNYAVDLLTGATYQQNAYITNGIFVDRVDKEYRKTWRADQGGAVAIPREYKFYDVVKGDKIVETDPVTGENKYKIYEDYTYEGRTYTDYYEYFDVKKITLKTNHLFIYANGILNSGGWQPGEDAKATLRIKLPPPQYFVGQTVVITNKSTGFPTGTLLLEQSYIEDIDSSHDGWWNDHICMTIKELLFDSPDNPYISRTVFDYADGEPVLTGGSWVEDENNYSIPSTTSICGIWQLKESLTSYNYPEMLYSIDLNEYDWLELTAVAGDYSSKGWVGEPSPAVVANNLNKLDASWMITRWEKKSNS